MSTTTTMRRSRTGWLRLGGLLAALTFAVALGLGAARADAQPSPQQLSPQLVGGFPALTLRYDDAQGPGAATITPQGPDPASGGTAVAMTLVQNDYRYTGSGFVRPGELGGYVLDVTVTGEYGDSYDLSGTLMHDQDGVRWRGHGRWWATWNRAATGEWTMAGGPYAEQPGSPQLWTGVRLNPVRGSAVSGDVTLIALPQGATRFALELSGMAPGKAYAIQLHAGTPAQPSASVIQVAVVHADAWGRTTASGLVRFRGTEDMPLLDIADGDHFLSVVGFGQTVAVGSIPALQPLG